MKQDSFEYYRQLLLQKSGLVVTPDKTYLLNSRLTPVAQKWKFDNLDDMTAALQSREDPLLIKDVVEAMTTNETSFFRDSRPFETLKNVVLPYLANTRRNGDKIRIWCAASSSGQEPYSIAILLQENKARFQNMTFEILATDISDQILDIARQGEYSQFEVQRGLPIQLLMKYFEQNGDFWKLKDEIRNMVRFQNFNLLGNMRDKGTFDVIFCRNVLIYFDENTKADILQKMSGQLASDGFLFLGGAETVLGITEVFKPHPNSRGLYILHEGRYDDRVLSEASAMATTSSA